MGDFTVVHREVTQEAPLCRRPQTREARRRPRHRRRPSCRLPSKSHTPRPYHYPHVRARGPTRGIVSIDRGVPPLLFKYGEKRKGSQAACRGERATAGEYSRPGRCLERESWCWSAAAGAAALARTAAAGAAGVLEGPKRGLVLLSLVLLLLLLVLSGTPSLNPPPAVTAMDQPQCP